jgi:hypothetical protein
MAYYVESVSVLTYGTEKHLLLARGRGIARLYLGAGLSVLLSSYAGPFLKAEGHGGMLRYSGH